MGVFVNFFLWEIFVFWGGMLWRKDMKRLVMIFLVFIWIKHLLIFWVMLLGFWGRLMVWEKRWRWFFVEMKESYSKYTCLCFSSMSASLASLLILFSSPGWRSSRRGRIEELPSGSAQLPLSNYHTQLSWHRLASLNVTFPELLSVVETNEKQRFALIPDPALTADADQSPAHDPLNPAHHLIRANQGHSIKVASENLHTPVLLTDPDCPEQVVHGTYESKWKLIKKSGGLRPMGRQHVHFALGLPSGGAKLFQPVADTITPSASTTEADENQEGQGDATEPVGEPSSTIDDDTALAPVPTLPSTTQAPTAAKQTLSSQPVISGMRASATVLIWVDLKRSLEAGALKWWRSANGVLLTEGDAQRKVGLEWVNRVEMRTDAKR